MHGPGLGRRGAGGTPSRSDWSFLLQHSIHAALGGADDLTGFKNDFLDSTPMRGSNSGDYVVLRGLKDVRDLSKASGKSGKIVDSIVDTKI